RKTLISTQDGVRRQVICEEMIGGVRAFKDEIQAESIHWDELAEWRISHAIWKYSGQHGDEPSRPKWPINIPEFHEAIIAVHSLGALLVECEEILVQSGPSQFYKYPELFSRYLVSFVKDIEKLERLLDAHCESDSNGPIDRNALAKL